MLLIPETLRIRLLAHGATVDEIDHPPVLKLFDPTGAATWLVTEMMADGDTLFGLCDLGMGCPELGYASLAELSALRLRFGLRIERDRHFRARFPLSVYAEAARRAGAITEADALLRQAAAALGLNASPDPDLPPTAPPDAEQR